MDRDAEALIDRIRELAVWARRVRRAEEQLQGDWEMGEWRADSPSVHKVRRLVREHPIVGSPRQRRLERLLQIAETLAAAHRDISQRRWHRAFRGLEGLSAPERPRCAEATRRLLLLPAKAFKILFNRQFPYPESELLCMRRELDGLVASLELDLHQIPGAVEMRARLETLEGIFGEIGDVETEPWPLTEMFEQDELFAQSAGFRTILGRQLSYPLIRNLSLRYLLDPMLVPELERRTGRRW